MKMKIERRPFNNGKEGYKEWIGTTEEERLAALRKLSIMLYELKKIGDSTKKPKKSNLTDLNE